MTQVLVRVHAAGLHRGDWHVIGRSRPSSGGKIVITV
jgi:NADPH:quinone reductase-like Zn-dependent oxidoreductase